MGMDLLNAGILPDYIRSFNRAAMMLIEKVQ